MSRKTFANTIRKDITIIRRGRRVEASGGGLTYRTDRANAEIAQLLNSKIPMVTLNPPRQ